MSAEARTQPRCTAGLWQMPLQASAYDTRPVSPREWSALEIVVHAHGGATSARRTRGAHAMLHRLLLPVVDVVRLRSRRSNAESLQTQCSSIRRVLYQLIWEQQEGYWQWNAQTWITVLMPDAHTFTLLHGVTGRPSLLDLAYLLCGFDRFAATGVGTRFIDMASAIFGPDLVAAEIARVRNMLVGPENMGYSAKQGGRGDLDRALALAMLLNRSPFLEAMSRDFFASLEGTYPREAEVLLHQVSKALVVLGVFSPYIHRRKSAKDLSDAAGCPDEWYKWAVAWFRTSGKELTIGVAKRCFGSILIAGRWLAATHPAIVSPEQWTEDLALEYRQSLYEEKIGQYVNPVLEKALRNKGLWGKPLDHSGISTRLANLRTFFNDLQNTAHTIDGAPGRRIAVRFKPAVALRLPRVTRQALLNAEPRDIQPLAWQKLAGAAALLARDEWPVNAYWPFEAVRALALLWITSARRSDELVRLRVDCLREEWDPAMLDEEGNSLPWAGDVVEEHRPGTSAGKIWYLRVPTNKYGGEFHVWIPPYTARAIQDWIALRAKLAPRRYDVKDREFADLLFTTHGRGMTKGFLNRIVIPYLCARAGIDRQDAKGNYTCHRGRSSRITLLRQCGMELADLAAYAGHKNTATIQRYARTQPQDLHRKVAKADVLSTIIDGIFLPDASVKGLPSLFWHLGYDTDGSPRFCGLPSYHACPHRLDCPKCGLHVGGEKARMIQDDPAGVPVTTSVPLTLVTHLRATEDVAVAGRVEVPVTAPIPPSAQFLSTPSALTDGQLHALADLGTDDARTQLRMALHATEELLAAHERQDGRNVLARTLRARVATVRECLAHCSRAACPELVASVVPGDAAPPPREA
jgi:integrase